MGKLKIKKGNILATKCDAIVVTVNCVGVMGKGIAKTIRLIDSNQGLYPSYVYNYHNREADIGKLFLYSKLSDSKLWDKKILFFPTKVDWRNDSKLSYLEKGLINFKERKIILDEAGVKIKSIAFPPLGAGLGNLNLDEVLDLMEKHLGEIDTLDIEIYSEFDKFAGDGLFDILKDRLRKIFDIIDDGAIETKEIISFINEKINKKLVMNFKALEETKEMKFIKERDSEYFYEIAGLKSDGITPKRRNLTMPNLKKIRDNLNNSEINTVEDLLSIKGISVETVKKCHLLCLDDEMFNSVLDNLNDKATRQQKLDLGN
jgi:O-acetyl-ADP-ribose deacetylase (regulator of RNase III)